jgi:AcrR family transcriptional regulator
MPPASTTARQRVPAAERRDALIDAAVIEFAESGLHGTPVDRVARRVGVAQPYVFSLFGSKRDLFLAAVARGFERVTTAFATAAEQYRAGELPEAEDILKALAGAYTELLADDRAWLMIQHQAYAACGDDVVRERVRILYAELVAQVARLAGDDVDDERIDDFFRYGMWLNVAAAMGVEDLSAEACGNWMREQLPAVDAAD